MIWEWWVFIAWLSLPFIGAGLWTISCWISDWRWRRKIYKRLRRRY